MFMKQLGVHHLKFDNFSMTKRRFKHFKAFKCHDDFWGKVISASATVIIGRKQICKVENSLQTTGQINKQSKDRLRMRNFNFPNIKHHASILLKFNHICHHCFSLVCTVCICGQVHELETQQMMDYIFFWCLVSYLQFWSAAYSQL